jgi:hypothetical protein
MQWNIFSHNVECSEPCYVDDEPGKHVKGNTLISKENLLYGSTYTNL